MFAVQIDAPDVVRRALRARIDGAPVRSELPAGWVPDDGVVVVVVGDGTPVSERAWTRENVRVSVHGRFLPVVRKVASEIDALLLIPGVVPGVSVSPGPSLVVDRDESAGGFIASVTVRVATTRRVVS